MDETSFYNSLHQLKLQLDLMNLRTSTLLNSQGNTTSSSSSMPPTMASSNSTPFGFNPPGGSTRIIPLPSQFQQIHDRFDTLTSTLAWNFDQTESSLDDISDRLDSIDPPQLTPAGSTVSNDRTDSPTHQIPPTQTAQKDVQPSKPLATFEDLGAVFDPHYIMDHPTIITDPFLFSARIRRLSRTKHVSNMEYFLRGSALRWYYIGFQEDGTHMYDDDNGHVNLEKFCRSLVMLFGRSTSMDDWLLENNTDVQVERERSDILEDYAFPILEMAGEERFNKQTVDNLLYKIRCMYQTNNQQHLEHPVGCGHDSELAHSLMVLRQMEFQTKRRIHWENKIKSARTKRDPRVPQKPSQDKKVPNPEAESSTVYGKFGPLSASRPQPIPTTTARSESETGRLVVGDLFEAACGYAPPFGPPSRPFANLATLPGSDDGKPLLSSDGFTSIGSASTRFVGTRRKAPSGRSLLGWSTAASG